MLKYGLDISSAGEAGDAHAGDTTPNDGYALCPPRGHSTLTGLFCGRVWPTAAWQPSPKDRANLKPHQTVPPSI